MSRNLRISLGLVLLAGIVLLGVANLRGDPAAAPSDERAELLVRPDSQRLSVADDGKVTFVEFLDFECEACRAAFPAIEELRQMYDGRVTFVVRNFPLHYTSVAAARAAEAAATQGQFEAMYQRLFETQLEWGEQQTPEQVFFGFAEDRLGHGRVPPPTIIRLRPRSSSDRQDGLALGVTGTPTFFLNGDKVSRDLQELIDLIDAARGMNPYPASNQRRLAWVYPAG